jgi:hypothetical protein
MPRGTDCLSLSPAIVAELAERAARIKATLKRSLLEVGRELTEAKHVLSHGQFTSRVVREVGMSIRTAQLIMGAHRAILKNENFSLLPKSALYILGATDVPASTRAALSKRIEAGDIPSYAEVRTVLRTGSRGVNPVNVAVNMREPEAESKAPVVSIEAYRVLARVDERLEAADREGLHERVREFRNSSPSPKLPSC